ncbi:MAG: metal-dependent hydrolase [Anaerolineales bacterium]|nr:metal-dependent hydrolase [Anaerolineales bacterium]
MSFTFTYFGHATLGLEINGIKIIIDPYFDDNPSALIKSTDVEADYILVSHGHGDHLGEAPSIAKCCNATIIANAEVIGWLRETHNLTSLHPLQIGGGHQFPFGYLKLTPALHGSTLPDGSYGGLAAGFLLTTMGGEKIYLAQDTGLFSDMALIGEEGITLAVLPIGDNYTMGPVDALRAVKMLTPRHVIPIHYNTWPIIQQDAQKWAQTVSSELDTQVHILTPGERFSI